MLIAKNTVYNKILIITSTLRSFLWAQKWSVLNRIVDEQPLRRTTETAPWPRFAFLFSEKVFYEYLTPNNPPPPRGYGPDREVAGS